MTEQDEQRGDPEVGVCHVCGKEFDTRHDQADRLRGPRDIAWPLVLFGVNLHLK